MIAEKTHDGYRNRVEGVSGAIAGLLALLSTYPLITLNTRQHVRNKKNARERSTADDKDKDKDDKDKDDKDKDDDDHGRTTKSMKNERNLREKPRIMLKRRTKDKKKRSDCTDDEKPFGIEKMKKLYVGVKPAAIGTVCSQGVYYYWFSFFSESLRGRKKGREFVVAITPLESFLAASLAGCVNVILTLPIWTVVAKMQVNTRIKEEEEDSNNNNNNNNSDDDDVDGDNRDEDEAHKWSAMKQQQQQQRRLIRKNTKVIEVAKEKKTTASVGFWSLAKEVYNTSGVPGFYGGLSASLIMVANPALQFAIYENLRQRHAKRKPKATAMDAFVLGAMAKIGATLVTYPMLVIKSRLQVGKRHEEVLLENNKKSDDDKKMATTTTSTMSSKKEYDGILDCVGDLYRNEGGFLAFYDGLTTKLSQTALCAALMFSSKEEISRRVDETAQRILARYHR